MRLSLSTKQKRILKILGGVFVVLIIALIFLFAYKKTHFAYKQNGSTGNALKSDSLTVALPALIPPVPKPVLDTVAYDKKNLQIANNPVPKPVAPSSKVADDEVTGTLITPKVVPLWPPKTVYPNYGALLPFNRIVAYYGNFYSKGMGVLGQYPTDVMLDKLNKEVEVWKLADPTTPVIPAIHYIVVTAQGSAGRDGKYRLRMPDAQIDHAIELAHKIHGLVFLDVQVALSNVQTEVPLLEKYLKMPDVHLGLDPEFSMKHGERPGSVIGTMDATDINWAMNYLAKIVQDNNLPPKILIIHRFTMPMVTNYKLIKPLPEVQFVMDMDGWGFAAKKINTYNTVITPQPVQFSGFKLFYKNDLLPPSKRMLTPAELLKLTPQPIYIQYQ
ncbi:MAG: hypothetical protein WCG55_01000 [bacterium]